MRLVYLPPYSPDFNPIEEAFSSIKAHILHNQEYWQMQLAGVAGDPYGMMWDAVYSVTPRKAAGWFRHSGYRS